MIMPPFAVVRAFMLRPLPNLGVHLQVSADFLLHFLFFILRIFRLFFIGFAVLAMIIYLYGMDNSNSIHKQGIKSLNLVYK